MDLDQTAKRQAVAFFTQKMISLNDFLGPDTLLGENNVPIAQTLTNMGQSESEQRAVSFEQTASSVEVEKILHELCSGKIVETEQ